MRLTRVRAKNFKSFRELDIRLDGLNVLIGANASGKSNLIQLFMFVRDIAEKGLENAVSIQGGAQYLRNINAGDDPVEVELWLELGESDQPVQYDSERVTSLQYKFALAFAGGRSVRIAEDRLWTERLSTSSTARRSGFELNRTGNSYQLDVDARTLSAFLDHYLGQSGGPRRGLLLEDEAVRAVLPLGGLKSIATYDVDPKGPKTAVLFGAKSDLEPDAHNLAIVLDRILGDEENRRKLLNLLEDILPFARELRTEPLRDASLFFTLREKFSHEEMPASFLSDGTIDIIAILVILYFEHKPIVVIEEPDRNLHPSLMSKLVAMLQDASSQKQIVVSTHNPELVRHVEPSQLILISRDDSGSSRASRPADKAQIQQFLRDEIGMDELYVQNLLEV